MLNPNEAPEGYKAVEGRDCTTCAFANSDCSSYACDGCDRYDGCDVSFRKIDDSTTARFAALKAQIAKLKEELKREPKQGDMYELNGKYFLVVRVGPDKLRLIDLDDANRVSDTSLLGMDAERYTKVEGKLEFVKNE